MSTENKDMPKEFQQWITENSEKPMGGNYAWHRGAIAAYRHLSPSSETEIRRSTIDRLYQSILASGQPFPGELRDIFHKAMNSLPTGPSSKPETGLREGEKVVLDRDFNNASVVTLIRCSTYYSTVSDGKSTWDVMTNRLYAIPDKSIPSSEPLPATEETKLNVEQIVQFTEEVGYFYEIVGGGKGKNLIWENIELGSRSTTAELLVCFLEGVGLRLSTIDMAEPAKESQPDAFLEWLDGNIEFCEPRAKREEIQDGTSGNYWTGQINLLRQVREKYLSLHARPKPEPSEEKIDAQKDFWYWFDTHFRSASENHDHASTGEKASYWEGYMDAMTAMDTNAPEEITQRSSPSSVKPEREDNWISIKESPEEYRQVLLWFEGLKTIAIGYLINGSWADENKNLLWCEPDHWAAMPTPPSHPSSAPPAVQQEDRRRGLKAFDDSMKDTLGKLIEPEDNPFASAEIDRQEDGEVPEDIAEWIRVKGRAIESRVYDLYDAAKSMGIAMCHKMQEDKLSPKALDEPEDDLVEYHDIRVRNVLDSQEEETSSLRSQLSAKEKEINQLNEWRKEGKAYKEMLEDKLTGLDKECSALRQEFDERLKLQIQLEAQLATGRPWTGSGAIRINTLQLEDIAAKSFQNTPHNTPPSMRQCKTQFYPDGFDGQGKPLGPCAMILDYRQPNSKRFNKMTKKEKVSAAALIAKFQGRLESIKNEILKDHV